MRSDHGVDSLPADTAETQYRVIPGCGDYAAGSDGTIWSRRATGKWKELKQMLNRRTGYPYVFIFDQPKQRKSVYVCRLVLLAFRGECPEGMEACHFPDRSKTNSRLENLRWDTKKANSDDARIHGTRQRGVRNGMRVMDEAEACLVLDMYRSGEKQRDIARKLGVSQAAISNIVTGRSWGETTGIRSSCPRRYGEAKRA